VRGGETLRPYLARATVVLVTDGEDGVDLELIRRTRAPMDSLDIALSFISLGEENQDLRSLVVEQRSKGGRAFYHHLSDPEIGSARTEFDSTWRTLLPRELPMTPAVLEALMPHLEALEAVAQGQVAVAPTRADGSFEALFPEKTPAAGGEQRPREEEVNRIADLLDAVGEAASLAPADLRAAESVTLLNHLLALYSLSMPKYFAALSFENETIRTAIDRVRLLCRPFG
jgi:hypothetical protein